MKVKIVVAIIALLALFTICYSAEIESSGVKSADAAIRTTGGGQYGGLIIKTDGTNDCEIKIHDDDIGATGKVLDFGYCVATASKTCKYIFPWPIPYVRGLYADMTVASGTCEYIIFSK